VENAEIIQSKSKKKSFLKSSFLIPLNGKIHVRTKPGNSFPATPRRLAEPDFFSQKKISKPSERQIFPPGKIMPFAGKEFPGLGQFINKPHRDEIKKSANNLP
jgi:hypothetical protein